MNTIILINVLILNIKETIKKSMDEFTPLED